MPFKSEKQRRYLFKNKPALAKKWTRKYGSKVKQVQKGKRKMDELTFVERIRKVIKMRHDDVVSSLASGGVDNMEKYQYMLGQIRTYQYISQEISSLLEKKEQKDNDGTVININSKTKD